MLRLARIFFVYCVVVFCATAIYAQDTWVWKTDIVDQGSAKNIAIKSDAAGNLHISYIYNDSFVKYAYRPAGDAKWYKMVVAQGIGFTNIALDSSGYPHICFTNGTAKDFVNYISFDGSTWHVEPIAPGTGTTEYYCSVAIAKDGTAHMTWYHERIPSVGNYLHFKYAVRKDGAWFVKTIDFDAQTGKWHSMVLDDAGNPHISYDAYVSRQMKYAYFDGKEWHIRVVERDQGRPKYRGWGSSLVLNKEGLAQISYRDEDSIRYAREQTDGTWKIDTVDRVVNTGAWASYRTWQALDSQGFPHICYEDGGTLKHAYWDGQRWNIQVLALRGAEPFRYASLTIDGSDVIYIAYRDPSDGSLVLATGHREAVQPAAVVPAKGAPAPANPTGSHPAPITHTPDN